MKRTALILITTLLFTSCKKETPPEPKNESKGVFVDKMAFVKMDETGSTGPMIYTSDLFNDHGTFSLYNSKVLREGEVPSLSPDRTWMTYLYVQNSIFLRRMNIDGSNNQEVTVTPSGLTIQGAVISPDNSTLAVYVGDLWGLRVGVIPASGGIFTLVYGGDRGRSMLPTWYPSSKRICFVWVDFENRFGHNLPPLAKAYIAAINVDGTGLQFISDTTSGNSNDISPNISPDGKSIVFTSLRSHPEGIFPEVFCMDIDGTNVRRLTDAVISEKQGNYYPYQASDDFPQWLNDNEHIIFSRNIIVSTDSVHRSRTTDVYIVDKSGTPIQQITNNGISSLAKK